MHILSYENVIQWWILNFVMRKRKYGEASKMDPFPTFLLGKLEAKFF
jgi:hypothetical protein